MVLGVYHFSGEIRGNSHRQEPDFYVNNTPNPISAGALPQTPPGDVPQNRPNQLESAIPHRATDGSVAPWLGRLSLAGGLFPIFT